MARSAATLQRFSAQIDSEGSDAPTFLALICGKGYGYRRPDGFVVIPIGAFGP